jgi:hypothetical protein
MKSSIFSGQPIGGTAIDFVFPGLFEGFSTESGYGQMQLALN